MNNNPVILAADARIDAASRKVAPSFLWPDPSFEMMWMNLPPGSLDLGEAGMRQYAVYQMIAMIVILFSSGTGSEVVKPMAAPTVGGLLTATGANLILVPVLYSWFAERRARSSINADT